MQTTRQSRSFRNWVWAEAAAKVGHFPLSQNQRRCPHRVSSDSSTWALILWTLFVSFIFFWYFLMKLFLCLTDTDYAKGGPQKPIANTGKTKGNEIYNVVYRQWRTMAFGKGQTWPEGSQRLLNNTKPTQRSPPLSPFQHWPTSKRSELQNWCERPPAGRWIIKLSKFYIYKTFLGIKYVLQEMRKMNLWLFGY